jgi:transposase
LFTYSTIKNNNKNNLKKKGNLEEALTQKRGKEIKGKRRSKELKRISI